MEKIVELFQGNNALLIILALFLFKDQIFALLQPKPTPPAPAPVPPAPAPAPVDPVTIDDRPVLKVLVNQVLPVLLPLLVEALKKQQDAEKK